MRGGKLGTLGRVQRSRVPDPTDLFRWASGSLLAARPLRNLALGTAAATAAPVLRQVLHFRFRFTVPLAPQPRRQHPGLAEGAPKEPPLDQRPAVGVHNGGVHSDCGHSAFGDNNAVHQPQVMSPVQFVTAMLTDFFYRWWWWWWWWMSLGRRKSPSIIKQGLKFISCCNYKRTKATMVLVFFYIRVSVLCVVLEVMWCIGDAAPGPLCVVIPVICIFYYKYHMRLMVLLNYS